MNTPPDNFNALPMWLAIIITVLVLAGALTTLIGSIGLARFKNFYERVHAPTLGSTCGMASIVMASILFYSFTEGAVTLKPLLIGLFLTFTTPVTLIILARAAIYRDRVEGNVVPDDDL